MAVTVYSEQELFDKAIGYFRITFPTQDLSDRGFFGLLARDFARFFSLVQEEILRADEDSVPAYQLDADGNARSRCSDAAADAWAFVFGLPSGVSGIYGRRGASISSGGVGTPGVSLGAVIVPAGTQASDPTGQILVQTTGTVTLNGPPNTLQVQFASLTTGVAANLPTGTVLTWIAPPAGLLSSVTLTSPLTGAEDRESTPALISRILRRIQAPPRGGTAADYREWAETAIDLVTGADLGIYRAYVYPLRSGLGTVDVVCTYGGLGLGRIPPAAAIAKVQTYLDSVRPIGMVSTALAPSAPTQIFVRVRATPSDAKSGAYLWDWNDLGTLTVIQAHTANTLTVLAVPANLTTAYAAGIQPRISVTLFSAGGSPLPFVARVVNITGLVLTLDQDFPIPPVDAQDYFFAGGGLVIPIATRVREYVESLGPSRKSGTFDKTDYWEDSVRPEQLIKIVLTQKDTDGTEMTIAAPGYGVSAALVGTSFGALSSVSYSPLDSLISAPELVVVAPGGIEVIQ